MNGGPKRYTVALKNVQGSATFMGKPSKKLLDAVNTMAELAHKTIKKDKPKVMYNQCGHNLRAYVLGYVAHHEEMEKRTKRGWKQKQCPTCGLFLFKDEVPTSPENINRHPI